MRIEYFHLYSNSARHQKLAPLSHGVLQAPVLFSFLNFISQTSNFTTDDVWGPKRADFRPRDEVTIGHLRQKDVNRLIQH